jgi:hypothetical protein
MTPWVLTRPSRFRLPPPLALNSPEYAADLNELKIMGIFAGSARTPDQSELALFWAGNTALYWNRIAAQLSVARGLTPTENARLFALLNVSISDAVAEIANARVFGGIHFRTSCVRGNTLGRAVADYVSRHAMRAPGDED